MGRLDKRWIYLPLYALALVAVWFLIQWAASGSGKSENIELPPQRVQIGKVKKQSVDCGLDTYKFLGGTFELTSKQDVEAILSKQPSNCQETICEILQQFKGSKSSASIFSQKGKGNMCLDPFLEEILKNHDRIIHQTACSIFFYDAGKSELTQQQKKNIRDFIKKEFKIESPAILAMGRASSSGNQQKNMELSNRRSEGILNYVKEIYGIEETHVVLYGDNPPALTPNLVKSLGVEKSQYDNIKYGSGSDKDYSLRLNQSVMLFIYPSKEDPFGLSE